VKARLGASVDRIGQDAGGSVTFRYQPLVDVPLSFIDVKAATSELGKTRLRGVLFNPDTGLGIFAVVPLTGLSAQSAVDPAARLGLRYSTPSLTAGIIANPLADTLTHLWLAHRRGSFTLGMQLRPDEALGRFGTLHTRKLSNVLDNLPHHLSYALSYTPERPTQKGGSTFTAALEVVEQRQLNASFLYHLAVQRLVHNPFEERDVVAITNYIDIGLQLVTNLTVPPDVPSQVDLDAVMPPSHTQLPASLRLGVAWQVSLQVCITYKAMSLHRVLVLVSAKMHCLRSYNRPITLSCIHPVRRLC
jgi:hypothetical protein